MPTASTAAVHPGTAVPGFADVVEAHLDDVHAYLVYLTRDRALAEDLTAATFERALRAWRRFDPRRASARTWLCRLARSTALDHFRAEQRRLRREERAAGAHAARAEDRTLCEGLSPELDAALRRLSAADREILALRIVLELDGPAAAAFLGVSPSTCSTRLARALKRLEEELRHADAA